MSFNILVVDDSKDNPFCNKENTSILQGFPLENYMKQPMVRRA